jgi:hypothetical protein
MKKILLLSLSVLLIACNKPLKTEYDQQQNKLYEYWEGTNSTFLVKEFRQDGSLQSEFEMSRLQKNGQQKNYSVDGKLTLITYWKEGRQSVKVERFNTQGQMIEDSTTVIYTVKPDTIYEGDKVKINVQLADQSKKVLGALSGLPKNQYMSDYEDISPATKSKVVMIEISHTKEGEKKFPLTLLTHLEPGIMEFHPVLIKYKVRKR